jgi:methionine aminopeptidase
MIKNHNEIKSDYLLIDKKNKFKNYLMEVGEDITSEMREIYSRLLPKTDIVKSVRNYDKKHRDNNTLLTPASIEINNIVSFYSPIGKYELQETDLVSITLAQKKEVSKGLYAYAKSSISKSMNNIPIKIDKNKELINACNEACTEAIKECGVDVRITSPRFTISEILDSYGVSTIKDICGYDLYNPLRVIPNTKKIPDFFSDGKYYKIIEEKMKNDDVLYIDVYGTDTAFDVKSNAYKHILLLYRTDKVKYLKGVVKNMLSFINNRYKKNLFSLREIMEDYPEYLYKKFPNKHKGRSTPKKFPEIQLKKLIKEGMIGCYNTAEISKEHKDQKTHNNVAHIGHTIHIDENISGGVRFIC